MKKKKTLMFNVDLISDTHERIGGYRFKWILYC